MVCLPESAVLIVAGHGFVYYPWQTCASRKKKVSLGEVSRVNKCAVAVSCVYVNVFGAVDFIFFGVMRDCFNPDCCTGDCLHVDLVIFCPVLKIQVSGNGVVWVSGAPVNDETVLEHVALMDANQSLG